MNLAVDRTIDRVAPAAVGLTRPSWSARFAEQVEAEWTVNAYTLAFALAILADAVPAERRGPAIGLWGAVGGLGVALGPAVGGVAVDGAHWSWIFWLNVPVGLAANAA